MSLARRLQPRVVEGLTSPRTRDARRWLVERRRRLRGEPHRIVYFHQVDDPYSQLAAKVLPELVRRYDVVLEPHLVGPPPDEAAPERALLEAFARKDAADVAPGYGLACPRRELPPAEQDVQAAAALLAGAIASGAFVDVAAKVGRALWDGDKRGLDALAGQIGAAEPQAAHAAVEAGSALRRRSGHYLGAMLHYGGEWYWGVDRLHHLERRLRSLGAQRGASFGEGTNLIAPRPDFSSQPAPAPGRRLTLEFYLSLRSPYTYIAMERVYDLARRLPVDLVLRPVLPMVMRGLPVPRAKRLYITLDTKREAEDAGVAFGRVCDPVGRPVERGFSLYPWAHENGRAAELLLCFARAAFGEGVDLGEDAGLRHVVEGAGLSWADARPHLDGGGWQEELEGNRQALLDAGLWGVPSFRLLGGEAEDDFCTWGADRIWRVEEEIHRRLDPARS